MQPIYHVELATPLPQDVQPCILLGRLVLDPHLKPSNLNLDGQLNPSPDRVGIEADIRREWHYDSHDVWTSKHSFVVGPARVWNALLAHEPSVQAIRKVAVDGSHGRLIVAVYTVNSIVTAVDYACVLFKEGKLVVNMKESGEYHMFIHMPLLTITSLEQLWNGACGICLVVRRKPQGNQCYQHSWRRCGYSYCDIASSQRVSRSGWAQRRWRRCR